MRFESLRLIQFSDRDFRKKCPNEKGLSHGSQMKPIYGDKTAVKARYAVSFFGI